MKKIVLGLVLLASPALAQQQTDPAKLLPLIRQQREVANDSIAACVAAAGEMQTRIAELEKKLAEAQAATGK